MAAILILFKLFAPKTKGGWGTIAGIPFAPAPAIGFGTMPVGLRRLLIMVSKSSSSNSSRSPTEEISSRARQGNVAAGIASCPGWVKKAVVCAAVKTILKIELLFWIAKVKVRDKKRKAAVVNF